MSFSVVITVVFIVVFFKTKVIVDYYKS